MNEYIFKIDLYFNQKMIFYFNLIEICKVFSYGLTLPQILFIQLLQIIYMLGTSKKSNTAEPFLIQQPLNATIYDTTPIFKKQNSFYSRFQIPPNIDICKMHRQATSFGQDKQGDETKCPCCNERIRVPMKMNCSISEIYKINEPVGFYFTFIKMTLLSLLFMIVFPGIYSIVKISQECQNNSANCDYIYGVPVPKLKAFYTEVSLILNAAIIIVQYIVVIALFYWNIFIHQKMRLYHKKASDQHAFLTGIDHSLVKTKHILDDLKDYSVEEVIYTHKIRKYIQLFAQKYKVQALKRKYEREGKQNKINQLNARLRKLDNQILPIKNKLQMGDEQFMRTDKVFLRFANSYQKKRFQQTFKKGLFSTIFLLICEQSRLRISNCDVYVERLGDPRQIIWQNLQDSSVKRFLLILLNNFILVCVLGLSYYFVVLLNFSEQQSSATSDILLSVSLSVIIQAVNFMLGSIINFTTEKQGRYTVTGVTSAILLKKILVFFTNTTLIPFSMFILTTFDPQQEDQMRNIFTLFIFCNLVTPIIGQIFQVGQIIKRYKRYKIEKTGQECLKAQIYANEVFEKMSFNLEQRYGLLCQRIMNCVFYAAIFPVGSFITALGLIITYFISKYQLLTNCAIPRHSFRLGRLVTQIAATFPFIYSVGYLVNLIVYQQNPTYNIYYSVAMAAISALISLIFVIFGHSVIQKRVKISSSDISKIHVNQQITYKDLNPTSFMTNDGQSSRASNYTFMKNLMKFSAFREGMNFSRLSRSNFNDYQRQLIKDQSMKDQ